MAQNGRSMTTITSLETQIFADALPVIQRSLDLESLRPADEGKIARAIELINSFGKTLMEFRLRVAENVRRKIQSIACNINPHLRRKEEAEKSVFGFLRQLIGSLRNHKRVNGSVRQQMIDFFWAAAHAT